MLGRFEEAEPLLVAGHTSLKEKRGSANLVAESAPRNSSEPRDQEEAGLLRIAVWIADAVQPAQQRPLPRSSRFDACVNSEDSVDIGGAADGGRAAEAR